MGKKNNILEAKNIEKSFKKRKVVKGVSLCLAEGEIIGLLGPNGSGKTTTFNIIIGQNATGKTSLLQALTLALLKEDSPDELNSYRHYINKNRAVNRIERFITYVSHILIVNITPVTPCNIANLCSFVNRIICFSLIHIQITCQNRQNHRNILFNKFNQIHKIFFFEI